MLKCVPFLVFVINTHAIHTQHLWDQNSTTRKLFTLTPFAFLLLLPPPPPPPPPPTSYTDRVCVCASPIWEQGPCVSECDTWCDSAGEPPWCEWLCLPNTAQHDARTHARASMHAQRERQTDRQREREGGRERRTHTRARAHTHTHTHVYTHTHTCTRTHIHPWYTVCAVSRAPGAPKWVYVVTGGPSKAVH